MTENSGSGIWVVCPTCHGWGLDLEAPEMCSSEECECAPLACPDCQGMGEVEM